MVKKGLLSILAISALSYACPTPQEFTKELVQNFNVSNFKIERIEPSPIKGLCEAVVNTGQEKIILYTDEEEKYLLLGVRGLVNIIDLKTKENLTLEKLKEINKISQNQIHELDKYVAFTYGKEGKVVYLFTDPECPFCQRLEPTLKKLADEGKIQVKVILFPLPFHPHAKEKAVAMVCQNIGWQGLNGSYWTEEKMKNLEKWQCEKGKKLVEESIKIGQKYNIEGTPTIITEDGKKIVGALPEPLLKKQLQIK